MKNLKDMLNESRGDIDKDIEKKAKEIAEDSQISTGESCEEECYDCAMLMAEWMKSYMIEKAAKWLDDNQQVYREYDESGFYHEESQHLIKDFKKAMEK